MLTNFMKSPLPNGLAVIVLVALIITWFTSILLTLREGTISTDKGWFSRLIPIFSILGIAATVDLVQAKGIASFLAVIVFVVFAANLVIPILKNSGKSSHLLVTDWYKWSILISTLCGIVVAGYLTLTRSAGQEVACGPSHGCVDVQNSRYAVLLGFLPVSLLGLISYVSILAIWLVWQFGPARFKKLCALAIWALCIFGILFSIYLTFLEPFVIGATCMWCISSAVLMIILLLLSTPTAQQAFVIEDE